MTRGNQVFLTREAFPRTTPAASPAQSERNCQVMTPTSRCGIFVEKRISRMKIR